MQEFLNLFRLVAPFLFTFRLPDPPSIPASQALWGFVLLWCLFTSLVVGGKESPCSGYRRWEFHPWVRKIPWGRAWQPTPVFLPGESHGQRAWRATVHGLKRIGHDLATKKRWFVLLILWLLITFFMVVEESMGGNLSCKKSFNC